MANKLSDIGKKFLILNDFKLTDKHYKVKDRLGKYNLILKNPFSGVK